MVYIGLFAFIISVVIGIILLIAGKGLKKEKFMLLISIHVILLVALIGFLIINKNQSSNYLFLLFVCSGIILSGIAWKSDIQAFLRIYFSIFLLTIPLFIFSPSMLLNFLTTMSFNNPNDSMFLLKDNYYIEKQKASLKGGENYKLIKKKGMFHQTIVRDIEFGGKLDSIKVLQFKEGDEIIVRGYSSVVTHVSTDIDSMDQSLKLIVKKQNEIEYKL
jgi:hypothetical protein